MRKNHIIIAVLVLVAGLIAIKKFKKTNQEDTPISHIVQQGQLDFYVYATGSLESEQSINIDAPNSIFNRELQIWEIAITDMVEEGTSVDSGDYVASLDHNMIQEKLVKAEEELELSLNNLEDSRLDSNLTLNNRRDAIISAEELVEEKELILAESKYESPATIQRSKMDKQKALRKLAQEKQSYELEKRKAGTKVKQREIDYERKAKQTKDLRKVLDDIIITAPQKGMVIYYNRRGEKRTVGSMVSSYRSTIATLPDLTSMTSMAYVNEIDVSKVKVGQKVELSVDAFPEMSLKGEVLEVANIGRTVSGSDAKVFEVKIKVLSKNTKLRPAMTTNNVIHTASENDVVYVPSETIFSNDSLYYVLNINKKPYKQIVKIGAQNENYTIIEAGVNKGDELSWTLPEDAEELEFEGWDIYEQIKQEKLEEEQKAKEESRKGNKKKGQKGKRNAPKQAVKVVQ